MEAFYEVCKISRHECSPFILGIHYAKRWPSVSYAFGLFRDKVLVGVVTYGTPASAPLRSGIAGPEYAGRVIELNRLVLRDNRKNEASRLVAASLRMLPTPAIVVSFADTEQNHRGTVYQACNFSYHGLSAKRTDWRVRGKEHLHGQTVADEFRGCEGSRADLMRAKYGDAFFLAPRPRKHRYLYLLSTKQWKKAARLAIRYPQEPYPAAKPQEEKLESAQC